ncbi:MAG: TetR/AcrR family transcriptional regulator [Burkholderiales bacterium]|nr:TetR/AcrR family transcriptional regulator [Burkholderiales bacterium]
MAQRKPPRRTRERILQTSLALFNRDGEPNVTTAHIADEMTISPGNLYYHFRNKDEIIGELYDAYATSVAPLLAVPDDASPGVEDLWFLLHVLFERMADYRFLYRDLDEITSRNRRLARRFADLLQRLDATLRTLCASLVRSGRMRASDREIEVLASNAALVCTYWMSWQRVNRGHGDELAPDQAAHNVLGLFAPYLVGDDRTLLERIGEGYLAAP